MPSRKQWVVFAFGVLALGLAASWYVAGDLTRPARATVGAPPSDLRARIVTFQSDTGGMLRGWFAGGEIGKGAILLLHGVRSNRASMLSRARLLHGHGYGVLLIDLQAHGESDGDAITIGARESQDALAALRFLREQAPNERIGALGVSLGGASLVLAQHPQPPHAVVIESVFASVEDAVRNRVTMRFGDWSAPLAQLLLLQMRPRLGIDPAQLSPVDRVSALHAPLFVINGAADQHATEREAYALFAAAAEPKQLWIIPQVAHVDLHRTVGAEYEQRILAFFERYLRRP